MIELFTIKNYRCYREETELSLLHQKEGGKIRICLLYGLKK